MPALVAAIVLCLLKPAASPPPRVRVDLVFDGPPMPARIEASAMEEVTRIWSRYGVDVHAMDPGGAGRDGAVRLPVVFEDRPDGRAAATVLGSVRFLDGVPEPAIVMYPNAIERIVSTSLMCSRDDCGWAPAFRQFILGRVLGRALAHEIGHILLRSRHHSATGLMRSEHALSHLVDPDRRRFALSSDEAARLTSVIGGD